MTFSSDKFVAPSALVLSRRFAPTIALLMAALFAFSIYYSPVLAQTTITATEAMEIEIQKGVILRLNRDAETIFVADPDIADVRSRSKKTIYVYGLKTGETTLYVLDKNDNPIFTRILRVIHNISRMESMIKVIAPDSRISIISLDGGIVLQGTVQTPVEADEVLQLVKQYVGRSETIMNRVRILAPTQVNLRVRFAEVSREILRAIGISWESVAQAGEFAFGVTTARPDLAALTDFSSGAINFTSGNTSITAIIDALEEEGIVSVLAEPNLTAISGETASFLAGGEFPIPVGVDNNEIEIEFKQYGVSLAFTPTVLNSNNISLKVRPEVSTLTDTGAVTISGITVPALITRRAETTVELASGQSFAIAGLIQSRTTNVINKIPGLGDLPILGKLFQSKRFRNEETELVIIVTPYLVRPVNPADKLLGPTDRPVAGRQFERMLVGSVNEMGNSTSNQNLSGNVGFIVE